MAEIKNIYEQLKRDEGYKLMPYPDTEGKTTIGIGHNLTDCGLTPSQVLLIFNDDLAKAKETLDHCLPWAKMLDEFRYGVLLNMTFNMGTKILEFKRMLAALQDGNWEQASIEMMDSKWADQVGDRAKRLARQMREGKWQ